MNIPKSHYEQIKKTSSIFKKNYGKELQDQLDDYINTGIALYESLKRKYERSQDARPFEGFLHSQLMNALLYERKKRNKALFRIRPEDMKQAYSNHKDFQIIDLLDSLSKDAGSIIQLITNAPQDFVDFMKETTGSCQKNYRARLRKYLINKGWTHTKSKSVINEIMEVFNA
jgi:hypothetical protein